MTNKAKEIEEIYEELLERKPLPAEVTYWLCELFAGGNLATVRRDLQQTHEYHAVRRLAQWAGEEATDPAI